MPMEIVKCRDKEGWELHRAMAGSYNKTEMAALVI